MGGSMGRGPGQQAVAAATCCASTRLPSVSCCSRSLSSDSCSRGGMDTHMVLMTGGSCISTLHAASAYGRYLLLTNNALHALHDRYTQPTTYRPANRQAYHLLLRCCGVPHLLSPHLLRQRGLCCCQLPVLLLHLASTPLQCLALHLGQPQQHNSRRRHQDSGGAVTAAALAQASAWGCAAARAVSTMLDAAHSWPASTHPQQGSLCHEPGRPSSTNPCTAFCMVAC